MMSNAALWGPMALMGFLALSDMVRGQTAIYIEHVLSNFQYPVYIYSNYLMFAVAIDSGYWGDYLKWGAFAISSMITHSMQVSIGTDAMYFLNDANSKWADQELFPSLFYLINWAEHDPRQHPDDYYYGGNQIYY